MREAHNTDCYQLTEDETIARYMEAREAQDAFKPDASKYRTAFLQGLAKSLALMNDTDEAKEYKILTHQAQQRATAARLRQVNRRGRKGLATKFEVGPLNNPTIIEDKQELEEISAQINEKRLTECLEVSEFITDQELFGKIGILAQGSGVEGFLNGIEPIPDHLNPYTKLVLKHMKKPAEGTPMGPAHLSLQEHTDGWRKAKEMTSSEPSLPDFSHYISASYDDMLAEMDRSLRETPMVYGFAPDEWNPMTTCSIPKKDANIRAEDQRTIVLFDPSYNMNNKWYGRRFMQHNESLGTIPKEQTGSRKGHSAAITALNKVLTTDIMRQKKQAGYICSNDATQCYDRILHNVAMMCMV